MNYPIGIIGLGKLGLCLALNLERCGYEVIGVDQDEAYIESIQQKTLQSSEPKVTSYLQESKNFTATTNYKKLFEHECEVIFVVVATPSLPSGAYDHSQIENVVTILTDFGKQQKTKHLVINSTTMPSYCDQIVDRVAALNYTLTYNPEFIAQGSIIEDQQYPDQILIGSSSEIAMNTVENVYTNLCKSKPVFNRMSLISAEITKLATNCFLTTKIAFANAIGDLAKSVAAEPDKILNAIGSDSRIGLKYLNYGYGYGGPCLPRDNRALMKFGADNDYELLLSKATDEANGTHLDFQHQQLSKEINNPIIFDHVSYKKGTLILEESQQLALALKLASEGRNVVIKEKPAMIAILRVEYGTLFSYEETK